MSEQKVEPEAIFKHALIDFVQLASEKYSFERQKSISLGHGESFYVEPRVGSAILKFVSYSPTGDWETSFPCLISEKESLKVVYKPLNELDSFEASSRINTVVNAASAITNLTTRS